MTSVVVPFPRSRDQRFVVRQAQHAAELNPDAGERHILQSVKVQAAAMRRRGIAPDLVERESKCLEGAIRAALWRAVMRTPGGSQ